jgi:plastocyanin
MRPRLLLAPFVLTVVVALAGCGADPEGPDGPTVTVGTTVTTTAQGAPATGAPGAPSSSAAPPDYDVELYDNSYDPATLAVPNFQKVTFTNKGTLSHTVTIVKQGDPPGSYLRDVPIQPNTAVDYNFPNDGTYNVFCRYHGTETSGMRMTITV